MKVKFSNATEFRHLQQREPKLLIPYLVYLRDSKIDLFFLQTACYFFSMNARRASGTHLVSLK